MDSNSLSSYTKKLVVPRGFVPPHILRHGSLTAEPLSRTHLSEDVAAVNSSIPTIRETRGGDWPPESGVSSEYNALDLAWHEREFRDHDSYAYAILDDDGEYVGCFYLYPLGTRTPLDAVAGTGAGAGTERRGAGIGGGNVAVVAAAAACSVDVSWWVTTSAFHRGLYHDVYEALRKWMSEEFGVWDKVWWSNRVIPRED